MPKKGSKPIDYKLKVKRGDRVQVIAGRDKGSTGRILHVNKKTGRIIVENVNIVMKHQKARGNDQKAGIIKKEAPIHASNVMYLHNGKPTRIGYALEVTEVDGKRKVEKKRIAKSTGDEID